MFPRVIKMIVRIVAAADVPHPLPVGVNVRSFRMPRLIPEGAMLLRVLGWVRRLARRFRPTLRNMPLHAALGPFLGFVALR
jgi:hypothetical protein